jgi:hypothetical protein
MRRVLLVQLLGVIALGLSAAVSAGAASGEEPMADKTMSEQSVGNTCKAAEVAAGELERARNSIDQAGVDAAQARFAKIERRASEGIPRGLATQLRLVNRTLDDAPDTPTTLRAARIYIARLVHGLTGIMLSCNRAGFPVTIEY